jgi:2-polyprenyl-6-methoxyphenol hydroxylase-like FAD-dependent oxidoreductase
MRTDIAIIGAGPAGMLLSHLLAAEGIESIVVESRAREYVAARIRAGILEDSSVRLLRSAGLGGGIDAAGFEHRGIYLQWPYSWLGVLADVAPSTDELIYAWHPDGFALHSMRSATVSRLYLQVPSGTDIADWPDDRIWDALATRLGHGQDGWQLTPGPITEKSVLPFRSFVQSPMRQGRPA